MAEKEPHFLTRYRTFKNSKFFEILFLIFFGLCLIMLWGWYYTPIIQEQKTLPSPHRGDILGEMQLPEELGRTYIGEENRIFPHQQKPELWVQSKDWFKAIEAKWSLTTIRVIEIILLICSFFGGIFGFLAGRLYFRNALSGFLLGLFFSIGAVFLSAGTRNFPLILTVSFFPFWIWCWIQFYQRFHFFWMVLLGLSLGWSLNFAFTLSAFGFVFTAFVIQIIYIVNAKLLQNNFKKNILWIIIGHSIAFLFFLGASGSMSLRLLTDGLQSFSNQTFYTLSLSQLKALFDPHYNDIFHTDFKLSWALFPLVFGYLFLGWGILFTAFIGALSGNARNFFLFSFCGLLAFLALGNGGGFLYRIGLNASDFIWPFLIGIVFLAAGGIQHLYQKRLYRKVLAILLLTLVIGEQVWATVGKDFFFTYSVQNNQKYQRMVEAVKYELHQGPGWNVFDEQEIVPKSVLAQHNIPLPSFSESLIKLNPDILDLYGTRIIFSDVITAPNPAHFQSITLNGEEALVNQKALPELFFLPLASVKFSSSDKIDFRLQNREVNFHKEAYVEEGEEPFFLPAKTPNTAKIENIETIYRDKNSWLIKLNVPTKGLLILGHAYQEDWFVESGDQNLSFVKVNNQVLGLFLEPGAHDITIRKKSGVIQSGWKMMKRTFWVALLFLFIELIIRSIFYLNQKQFFSPPPKPIQKKSHDNKEKHISEEQGSDQKQKQKKTKKFRKSEEKE